MATPAPAPAPTPSPAPAPSQPPPGYRTTEAWLYFLVILLNGLFSSNLVVQTSEVGKMITLGLGVLAALGYGANRTMLKIAHVKSGVAPANDNATPQRLAQAGSVSRRVMLILAAIAAVFVVTCGGAQKWTNSFVGCEKANFGKTVNLGSASEDVLRAVEDLIFKNPADLELELAGLAIQATQITINCAITASEDFFASLVASGSATGSSGSTQPPPATPQLRARARAAYPGLKRALDYAMAHPTK